MKQKTYSSLLLKLVLVLVVPVVLSLVFSTLIRNAFLTQPTPSEEKQTDVLVSFRMKDTNWKDLGVVSEPLVVLPVKTKDGYKDNKFLLDSGAVISSLPREWVDELGLDLAFLPRSTFGGFGGKTSVAYQGEMMVLLADREITLPVVFTEAAGTKSLLGRKGLFNQFSILFNHSSKQVEIRE